MLLASLAAAGGLHPAEYAAAFGEAFGPSFEGYRDVSTKGFLRNAAAGMAPPLTGAAHRCAPCACLPYRRSLEKHHDWFLFEFVERKPDQLSHAACQPIPSTGTCAGNFNGHTIRVFFIFVIVITNDYLVPSGAADAQANCVARLAPLVALFAGHPRLMTYVEYATRVTQNSDAAVAWGCAGAAVLERLVLGHSAAAAVAATIDELEAPEGALALLGSGTLR